MVISLPGLTVRDFRGIPSIQEVECWAKHVQTEAKLLTLKLFEVSRDSNLAYVNYLTNECVTFGEFSSCVIDVKDMRNTKLRLLVSDLAEDEVRTYGCLVTSLKAIDTHKMTWTIDVRPGSEFRCSLV